MLEAKGLLVISGPIMKGLLESGAKRVNLGVELKKIMGGGASIDKMVKCLDETRVKTRCLFFPAS